MIDRAPTMLAPPVDLRAEERSTSSERSSGREPRTFIDLFAGCGGLSVGMLSAGWQGLFAVERDELAFETLKHNLIDGRRAKYRYKWPSWLDKGPIEIARFIKIYREWLEGLRGQVDLIAGGPPCQGFSMAGRRRSNDPRNELFRHYVQLVGIVQPSFVLLENVKGISIAFRRLKKGSSVPFSERIQKRLERLDYKVFTLLIRGTDVGVPQFRPRYIMVGIRRELLSGQHADFNPFSDFETRRKNFLKSKRLPLSRPVTVSEAISDLELTGKKLVECVDSPGFLQIKYEGPATRYQRLMHGRLRKAQPNSLRLARHREETRTRFEQIITTCRQGVQLSAADRAKFNLKKHCIVPLHGDAPSHTLTTLPDDFLHYLEPRILTVREYARLQSFPDWFEFRGKYTTGGDRRLRECPRYTQAGNAVPPYLAEVVGLLLFDLHKALAGAQRPD